MIIEYEGLHYHRITVNWYQITYASVHKSYLCTCMRNKYQCKSKFV